jgi:hypothetical protein
MKQEYPDAIERARAGIRDALALWDATDLSKICQCRTALESAVGALHQFQAGPGIPVDARRRLAALQNEAGVLNRLVDSSLAFQRGLLLRLGINGAVYGASGRVLAEGRHPELPGLEA